MLLEEQFTSYLVEDDKSKGTIDTYVRHVKGYAKWFEDTKGLEFNKVYQENVRDFVQYLTNEEQKPSTINTKVNAIAKYSEFLVEIGVQEFPIQVKKNTKKVQQQYVSFTDVDVKAVERFRQWVLENSGKRNYAIVTLLAYAGLRISEALSLRLIDVNLTTREITVVGKGNKVRSVMIGAKVYEALVNYLQERESDTEYLFISREGNMINRTVINKLFNNYEKTHRTPKSEKLSEGNMPLTNQPISQIVDDTQSHITPHTLRHFYCTYALEMGMEVHAVANQAGHSNIQTTMIYANPNKKSILSTLDKM